jgi:hypothetical protein
MLLFKEILEEQISPIYKVQGTDDFSAKWWIEPSGKVHHFLDRHIDFAQNIGEIDLQSLLNKGWIRQYGNSFDTIGPLNNKIRDLIFMRAKELGYEKIYVDVFDKHGNFIWKEQLINQEPEALYEYRETTI